MDMIMLV